ncbi:DUF5105 domain-containing protein [Streptococcus salivarius]|jgi:hypothetical protein|uniref:DUF5105 domain-containing protein n=1 Tax=Streptococcus salivarius TaxID=1304 RepID=A0AB35IVN4_STRSL|nr:DUF5105 domain-containing protein [Streptococcus salivarius]MDU8952238.1 DUF5105 domain-containing protein [Streptococcus sp.]MCB7034911.1 DUF5105 domain-containing protein [Streptococcus salivarius]MDB8604090.1 DUF5105 domain-containing protein [Streptococcus salivarius]MDB8606048.1 DUF5105 domain-containing protein [Streptococcus salivarius]MDB8608009.1 DUF5105 domain-containing protein [Streptococcus salivarius]
MKKYLYSGALALAAILTLSACAKPKLDAKLSVNDIVYMSGSDLKLKDDQTLVEVSFKLENTSEDMENELKTSAKQFYLKDKDGKKVTASKLDKGDLPTLFNKNKNVEDATDDFGKLEADDYKTVSLFFEVNNDESYKLYFESKDEKTEGQTVSTNLKDFDGKTTTNVKKAVDAYFNAVLLGGESKDYSKFVSNDLDKAKGELNQYFSDSLQYSYDDTDHIKPTGDEIPKVFGWVQTANRERGSYTVDNIIVAKDKAEFNVSMSTISMKAADDAYGANHPNLTDDLKNYLQSNGANAGNVDQLTRQYYMETYLPNSIKEVSPSAPKTEGTNIFDNYSVELTKKDDKWAFPDKDSYVGKWDYYPLFYAYTGQQGTLTKNY